MSTWCFHIRETIYIQIIILRSLYQGNSVATNACRKSSVKCLGNSIWEHSKPMKTASRQCWKPEMSAFWCSLYWLVENGINGFPVVIIPNKVGVIPSPTTHLTTLGFQAGSGSIWASSRRLQAAASMQISSQGWEELPRISKNNGDSKGFNNETWWLTGI